MTPAALLIMFALLLIATDIDYRNNHQRRAMSVLSKIPTAAKAITAAVTGFGSSFALAYGDQIVTTAEWIQIAVATVLSAVAVFSVPNKQADDGGPED